MPILTQERIESTHGLINNSGILNLNPEFWHKVAVKTSDTSERISFVLDSLKEALYLEDKPLEVQVGNMILKNPVGLAAGFAKQSNGLKFWEAFGFGYMTIGGITANAQTGNLKPRIFKFPELLTIVNGMGLPGDGIDAEVKRLAIRKHLNMMPEIPLIANLCNSATTKEDEKIDEFKLLMTKLYFYVDAFEINVSCPNQGGVCDMQQEAKLKKLLTELQEYNKYLSAQRGIARKTMLVKIAPLTVKEHKPEEIKDLAPQTLELIANVCNDVRIDGVTATNTSQEHNLGTKIVKPDGNSIGGGMSGLGIREQSLKTVSELRKILDKDIPIIGVGGIGYDKGQSGVDMMDSGAKSIEVLSSFIQQSVTVPYNLKKQILKNKS